MLKSDSSKNISLAVINETPVTDTVNSDPKLIKVLDQRDKITEVLLTPQQKISLPKQTIETFDGQDITLFKTFITRFENVIEKKCTSEYAKFVYLEQYTSGEALSLVQSCVSYDPSVAFRRAKELLMEEFDDEYKVANAYIEGLDRFSVISANDLP